MTCEGCTCSQACGSATSNTLRHKSTAKNGGESRPLWSTTPAKGSNDQAYGSVSSMEPIGSSTSGAPAVAPERCESNNVFRGGVCCRELKASDQRRLVDPDMVRDVIIGLSDGLTVSTKTHVCTPAMYMKTVQGAGHRQNVLLTALHWLHPAQVPFALTAGLSGVGSTRLVVVAGLAELVSGAISMGQ